MSLRNKLEGLSQAGTPIRVGLVGAGQMGRGFIAQVSGIPGMEVVAAADVDAERALTAFREAGREPVEGLNGRPGRPAVTRIPWSSCVRNRWTSSWRRQASWRSVPGWPTRRSGMASKWSCSTSRQMSRSGRSSADGTERGRRLHRLGRGRTGRDHGALRLRPVPWLRGHGRRQGQEQSPRRLRHPRVGRRRGGAEGDEPQDAGLLRRWHQDHGRDGGRRQRDRLLPRHTRDARPEETDPNRLGEVFSLPTKAASSPATAPWTTCAGWPRACSSSCAPEGPVRETLEYLGQGGGPNHVFYRPYHLTSLETPISVARAAVYGEPTIVLGSLLLRPRSWPWPSVT